MENCLLCKNAPADKTNSHIIPFFLIKTLVNEEGKTGRDKEVSFQIGSDNTDVYFGRSVSTDAINETLGRDLTEEDIEKNINHYTQDNFLCSNCEKRLSYLESYYSKKGEINNLSKGLVTNEVEVNLSFLFWASILWRISITDFPGPKLNLKEEKKLRNILNSCLGNSIEETKEKTQQNILLLKGFQTIILFDPNGGNPTEKVCLAHPFHRFPYSLIINDYVVFFYFKSSHFNSLKQSLWGYEKYQVKENLNSIYQNNEAVFIVSEEETKQARRNIMDFKAEERISKLDKVITKTVLRFFPQLPSNTLKLIILDTRRQLAENKSFSSLKFKYNDLTEPLFKSITKYLGDNLMVKL